MSLTNPNKPVTEARLQEFYHRIKSYLGFTEMPSEDMDDVISPLPSVQPRYHKYSTEEHIVGEWIDGKPIYEKTVDCGALPNATSKSIAHGIDNLNEVIKAEGYAMDNTSPSGRMPLPFVDPSAVNKAVLLNTDRTRENIVITAGTDRRAFINSYVTIQYTKSE